MRIDKIYCDHCGKEVFRDKFVDVHIISYNSPALSDDYDLCNECARPLATLLRTNERKESESDDNN